MRNDENLLDEEEEKDDVAREGDDMGFDDDDIDDVPIMNNTTVPTTIDPTPIPTPAPPPPPVQISDEMRERMERNKRIAMEKRLARLQVIFLSGIVICDFTIDHFLLGTMIINHGKMLGLSSCKLSYHHSVGTA